MQDFAFMTTEEHFILQDALKKNKKQVRTFALIGVIILVIAAVVPQLLLYRGGAEDADQSMFSYTNVWFWLWLVCFVVVLIFALIKVTEVRYFTIKKDLMALQKGTIQSRLEAVYHENNDTQTNFLVVLPNSKRKRLFYWTRGQLNEFREGNEVEISYARYSRVVLDVHKKSASSHTQAAAASAPVEAPVTAPAEAAFAVTTGEALTSAHEEAVTAPVEAVAATAVEETVNAEPVAAVEEDAASEKTTEE